MLDGEKLLLRLLLNIVRRLFCMPQRPWQVLGWWRVQWH